MFLGFLEAQLTAIGKRFEGEALAGATFATQQVATASYLG